MSLGGAVKLVVSAVMLALVLRFVDLSQLEATFRSVPLSLAVIVIAAYSLGQVINTFKWWLIARSAGITASFSTAVRATFVGMFANFFGLGTLGGDVLRGILLTSAEARKAEGIASVVADRVLGLAVLTLIGLISAIIVHLDTLPGPVLALLVLFAASVFVGWFLGPALVLRYFPRGNRLRLKVEQIMGVFPRNPGKVLELVLISVVFHFTQITLFWFIAYRLALDVPFRIVLSSIPFVNIVSTLPVSWNGLGVRENAYYFFLCKPGFVSEEHVVLLGAIWLLGVTGSSLVGGIVAWLTGDFRLVFKAEK